MVSDCNQNSFKSKNQGKTCQHTPNQTYHHILHINLHIDIVNHIAWFWKMICFLEGPTIFRSNASGVLCCEQTLLIWFQWRSWSMILRIASCCQHVKVQCPSERAFCTWWERRIACSAGGEWLVMSGGDIMMTCKLWSDFILKFYFPQTHCPFQQIQK